MPAGRNPPIPRAVDGAYLGEVTLSIVLHNSFDASFTGPSPSFWYNKSRLGPAALFKAFRFTFDSRDDAEARRHTIFDCNECCPKSLNITADTTRGRKPGL